MFASLKSNKAINAIQGLGWRGATVAAFGAGMLGLGFSNRMSARERDARLREWYDETHNQARNAAFSLRDANPDNPMWK